SPSDGVYRETAMKVVLGEGAAGMGGGSLGSPAAAAGDGGAVEVNLARAQVRASLGQEEPPAEDVPAGGPPPGPNLPNTGAGTLDLPFLLLGLGLVTGGLWIIMYGRSEQLEQ
ncbi:MAG: LPXTG cell wall anchor domain-containing protein, partial [Nocardioidaceae bacterium]